MNTHIFPPPPDYFSLTDQAGQADRGGTAGELPAEGPPTAAAVAEFLGSVRPDVVHLHHGYNLPDACAIAEALDVPLIATFWGYDVTALPNKKPERVLPYVSKPDVVLVPSHFLGRTVEALGVTPARIKVVPGSLDTRYFSPSPMPDAPRVGFVGRFVPKKGIDTLLRAWPEVRRAVPDAELTMLGFGEEPPSSDPSAGITVLTPDASDPRGQVRDLIRWCRVYVSPSKTAPDGDAESQHIGNLEAQAGGRAVLTTDHGPIPEFIEDGVTGVVVPEDDPDALAASMISLLQDVDRCRKLAHTAREAVQAHDVSVAGTTLDTLYDEVATGALR